MAGKHLRHILILFVLSYFFLIFGNGLMSLTNPDEVFYAQTTKEMSQHKSWLTPYLFGAPQFEKPVLLYWLVRAGSALFGNPSFAARFFPALFGCFGVIAVYLLAFMGFRDEKKAFVSSLILLSSGLYIGLSRTLFTDMIFSILILFSLVSFYWGYSRNEKKGAGIILFFMFSALAVLTKGPLGFLIPSLIVLMFLFLRKDARFLLCTCSLWGLGIFIAVAFPWYIFMISTYGASFTHEFFYNDHIRRFLTAEHPGNDTWYFYPSSMIGCMFPWSLYVLAALIVLFMRLRRERSVFSIFLLSWIAVVFIIFQSAHSKLVSYVFPAFPALALIAGDYVFDAASSNNRNRTFRLLSIFMAFVLFAIPVVAIFLAPKYSSYLSSGTAPYAVISLLFILSAVFLFFVLRRWSMKAVLTLAFVLPAIWFIAPFARQGIEPYVSSKLASEYLVRNYQVDNPIVCSKFFARGVRYYTDKDIVVLGTPKDFFSPHPITYLGSDEEITNYFRDQKVTFCILEKSSVENIKRIAGETFKLSVLKTIGNEYVVEIGHGEAAPSR